MRDEGRLTAAFARYFQGEGTEGVLYALVVALRAAGYQAEADALLRYHGLEEGQWSAPFSYEGWPGHPCRAGVLPPPKPQFGDLWFDVVELVPMVFLQPRPGVSADLKAWVSTRPVLGWQFRSFLNVAEVGRKLQPRPHPHDYLARSRFFQTPIGLPITDIYQDEAQLYARWFGKMLAVPFALQDAETALTPEHYDAMFPPHSSLWSEWAHDESWRLALTREAAARWPDRASFPDSVICEEWVRRPDIGMLTILFNKHAAAPYSRQSTYFELNDYANRDPG